MTSADAPKQGVIRSLSNRKMDNSYGYEMVVFRILPIVVKLDVPQHLAVPEETRSMI